MIEGPVPIATCPVSVCWYQVIETVPPPLPVDAIVASVYFAPSCVTVGVEIVTGGQALFGLTVTVTVLLFTGGPQLGTVACTQYDVVAEGLTVSVAPVCPKIGLEVSPAAPVYHCSVRFGPPVAMALKSVDEPCVMVRLEGVAVTVGDAQLTVTVAALLSMKPQEFVM